MTICTQLQQDATYRVFPILQANPDHNQRDIAHRCGMNTGGLNYYLKTHIAKSLATKAALKGLFLQRKLTEYQALQAKIVVLGDEASVDLEDSVYLETYLEVTLK